jgi:hypothetical protein
VNRDYLGDVCAAPAPPTALFLVTSSSAGAEIGWSGDGSTDVIGYNLYRKEKHAADHGWVGDANYPTVGGQATSYLDPVPGQMPGEYEYCITALNPMGNEGDSFCASIVTEIDHDEVPDDVDNCPFIPNQSQINSDSHPLGDD